ncbi:hypothetical protein CEXT_239381 [Caerostris extrusa]|uniref:Uncharacterized protein n=1 Tax=Caerostris extrusa TaxID=172846 RepID=A0AAV4XEH5_CAEEX|nr:hypothetical protein CEXT_239381 [Caerostris extrusa]
MNFNLNYDVSGFSSSRIRSPPGISERFVFVIPLLFRKYFTWMMGIFRIPEDFRKGHLLGYSKQFVFIILLLFHKYFTWMMDDRNFQIPKNFR